MMQKKTVERCILVVFIVLILAGIALRVMTLDSALSFDEYVQTRAVIDANEYGLDKYTEMNPLTTWTRIAVTSVLDIEVWTLRLTSLIFGLATIALAGAIAWKWYGKAAGIIAALLLSLHHGHMLVSTSVSFDGTFLTFYTLLALYSFSNADSFSLSGAGGRKWVKARFWWNALCGVSIGLAVLTKYTGALAAIALLAYSAIMIALQGKRARGREIKNRLVDFSIIGAFAITIFSVFPIIVFIFLKDPSYFWIAFQHGASYFGGRAIDIVLLAVQYTLAAVWIGPLFLFSYIFFWKLRVGQYGSLKSYAEKRKPEMMMHVFIATILAFYTFVVQDPYRPVERYFSILYPLLAVMASALIVSSWDSLNREKRKKETGTGVAAFFGIGVALAAVFSLLSFLDPKIIPFYPKTNFVSALVSLDWNILVPFTGDQGPFGLYIPLLALLIAFILGAAGLALSFAWKRNNQSQAKALGIVLIAGLGLSIFMMAEMTFHITTPDIGESAKAAASYAKENFPDSDYVAFRDTGLQHYLGKKAVMLDFTTPVEKAEAILEREGILVFVDFPAIDKKGELWTAISAQCALQKEYYSPGFGGSSDIPLAYVFSCGMPRQ